MPARRDYKETAVKNIKIKNKVYYMCTYIYSICVNSQNLLVPPVLFRNKPMPMLLEINFARGKVGNRICISYKPLPKDPWKQLPTLGRLGGWTQISEDSTFTLRQAFEFASLRLPRKRAVDLSIWPQLDFNLKTELNEKKVVDFK